MCSCELQNFEEQFEGKNWIRQESTIIYLLKHVHNLKNIVIYSELSCIKYF